MKKEYYICPQEEIFRDKKEYDSCEARSKSDKMWSCIYGGVRCRLIKYVKEASHD